MNRLFKRHEQKVRYLLVGGWNTLFGYLLFLILYGLLSGVMHYMVILTIGFVISLTNAYICYKFLVFRTRGNYLREYGRFYLVYGAAYIMNLALLPAFVELLKMSPVLAQAIIVLITVIISYIAHRNFSFKAGPARTSGLEEQEGGSA